jgi:hypothetical protein
MCKKAAYIASNQLDRSVPLKERILAVTATYAHLWGGVKGVKQDFSDALTLYACAQPALVVNKKPVHGETNFPISIVATTGGAEVHTTALEAVDLVRSDMQKAATAAREVNGIGRKKAERAPQTPTAGAPAQTATVVNHDSVMRLVASNLFAADKVFIDLLVKTCAANGWTLKASK